MGIRQGQTRFGEVELRGLDVRQSGGGAAGGSKRPSYVRKGSIKGHNRSSASLAAILRARADGRLRLRVTIVADPLRRL